MNNIDIDEVIDGVRESVERLIQSENHTMDESCRYTEEELDVFKDLASLLFNSGERAFLIKMAMTSINRLHDIKKIEMEADD